MFAMTRSDRSIVLHTDRLAVMRPRPSRDDEVPLLTPFSIVLVLLAAFMHAGWNALLRGGADRAQSMADHECDARHRRPGDARDRRACRAGKLDLCGRVRRAALDLYRAAGA